MRAATYNKIQGQQIHVDWEDIWWNYQVHDARIQRGLQQVSGSSQRAGRTRQQRPDKEAPRSRHHARLQALQGSGSRDCTAALYRALQLCGVHPPAYTKYKEDDHDPRVNLSREFVELTRRIVDFNNEGATNKFSSLTMFERAIF